MNDATKYKAYSTTTFRQITQLEKLSSSDINAIDVVSRVLPFKANNYVIDELINWDEPLSDPIFNLTFPRREMLSDEHYTTIESLLANGASSEEIKQAAHTIRLELNPHPSAQSKNIPTVNGNILHGVQHKYRETVLFFPSQGQTCHAYCTFCFRWPQFVGMNDIKFAAKEIESLVAYLKEHPTVSDVLFTGGDPMIMKTRLLRSYIEPLLDPELTSIKTIRIGTKALSYWPYRFTEDEDSDDLLRLFDQVIATGKNLSIMAHFNHFVELDTVAQRKAVKAIRNTGAQIRTQSPIIKHINNDPKVWASMWREQVNQNMIPYYMFIERDTGPKAFFEIPLVESWNIFRKAYQSVSGVCRTVRGPVMSATPGKVQILGVAKVAGEEVFTMRFLQGRDPDWVARPFFARFDPTATWLSDLVPAFGGSEFFFEEQLKSIFNETYTESEVDNFE